MTDLQAIRYELLADLEETLEAQGYLPMYDFAWTLRGYDVGLSSAEIQSLSLETYGDLTNRISLRLMWATWPSDVEGAWEAGPSTKLDFDLDPDGDREQPYLLLIRHGLTPDPGPATGQGERD